MPHEHSDTYKAMALRVACTGSPPRATDAWLGAPIRDLLKRNGFNTYFTFCYVTADGAHHPPNDPLGYPRLDEAPPGTVAVLIWPYSEGR